MKRGGCLLICPHVISAFTRLTDYSGIIIEARTEPKATRTASFIQRGEKNDKKGFQGQRLRGQDQNSGICFILEFRSLLSLSPFLKREGKHISKFQFGSEKAYNSEKVLLKCAFLRQKKLPKYLMGTEENAAYFGTQLASDCLVLHEQISWSSLGLHT